MSKITLINVNAEQIKIGGFIKTLRERRGLTQAQFAKVLATSQSAVARMEAGRQNFTTRELAKISEALDHQLLSLDETIDFKITGGRRLKGEINTNPSKNGALGLMCAALLNKSKTILHGIPRIEEVNRLIEVMQSIGVAVNWIGERSLEIRPPTKLRLDKMDKTAAGRIRSSLMLIGPLLHHFNNFIIPHAGGCKMGNRTIAAHRYGLEELGVKIVTKADKYEISVKKLTPAEIVMYEASDTAAEHPDGGGAYPWSNSDRICPAQLPSARDLLLLRKSGGQD